MTIKNRIIFIVAILILLILLIITPYYLIRNDILLNNETLSSLGSYIAGGVSILNLFVFVYLTILIARYEEVKSINQIKAQKMILQSQIRQSELDKFVAEIEKPFDTSQTPSLELSILRFTKASLAVNNFINKNQYLFPLLKNPEIFSIGSEIHLSLTKMIKLLGKNNQEIDKVEFDNIFIKVIDEKDRFLYLLQAFIIDELET